MKRTTRRLWAGVVLAAGFGVVGLVGCSGSGGAGGAEALGTMNLPLTTEAASGTAYRLRNATFVVQTQGYYYDEFAGAGGDSNTNTVSSETDPTAKNISLSLEEGYYYVQLRPGWSLEKATPSGAQTVEATLLTGSTQWVYVSRQSTSYAEFSFGIGGREVWLNGKLNIAIDVQETPGGGGEGGASPYVDVASGSNGI